MRPDKITATKRDGRGHFLDTSLLVANYVLRNIPGAYWKIPALFFLGIAGIGVTVMVPLLNARIINVLVSGSGEQFKRYLLFLGIAFLAQIVLMLAHQGALIRIEEELARRIRRQMFRGVLQMNLRTVEEYRIGDIQSRIVNDSGILKGFLSTILLQTNYDIVMLTVLTVLLYRMNRILMLIAILWTPMAFLLSRYLAPKMVAATKGVREGVASLQSSLQSWISRLLPVWAFRLEPVATERFEKANETLTVNSIRTSLLGLKGSAGSLTIASIPSFLIFVYGGYLVQIRILTIGELVAFLAYFSYFNAPFQRLAAAFMTGLPSLDPVWHRCHALLARNTPHECNTLRDRPDVAALVARQAAFQFGSERPFRLYIPEFSIRLGEVIGIIGPNGSGKSTFAKLLSGLYLPTSGAIGIESATPCPNSPANLRDVVAYLPQQSMILDGTLSENISAFDPHPQMDRLEEIARELGMHQLVDSLENGWMEVLDGGKLARLSGGQLQRIALGTVLYRDLPVLVLDEPSGNLDEDVLALFKHTIRSRGGRWSIVLITHSRELLSLCDRTYSMSPSLTFPGEYTLLPDEVSGARSIYATHVSAASNVKDATGE